MNPIISADDMVALAQMHPKEQAQVEPILGRTFEVDAGPYTVYCPFWVKYQGKVLPLVKYLGCRRSTACGVYQFHPGSWTHWLGDSESVSANKLIVSGEYHFLRAHCIMDKRTYVALGNVFDPKKHNVNVRYVSRKLDGMRFFWDGGISRGLLAEQVPYANIEKDFIKLAKPRATGLWSRYGKVITPPDWWLDQLPEGQPLDGELYTERNQLQIILGTAKTFTPDHEKWRNMKAMVFDAPAYHRFWSQGRIYENNHSAIFGPEVQEFIEKRLKLSPFVPKTADFLDVYRILRDKLVQTDHIKLVEQHEGGDWRDLFDEEISLGGEGVVFREKFNPWVPRRSDLLLKHKPEHDSEAVIIGWTSGEETSKGSKLLGLMGSIRVSWNDRVFDISGFTDHERTLMPNAAEWAQENPGTYHPDGSGMLYFRVGERIQFKYGEMTADGVPRRAGYKRKRRLGED